MWEQEAAVLWREEADLEPRTRLPVAALLLSGSGPVGKPLTALRLSVSAVRWGYRWPLTGYCVA